MVKFIRSLFWKRLPRSCYIGFLLRRASFNMSSVCPRYNKTFNNDFDEKYNRLVFPRPTQRNSIPYDGLENYNHTAIFQDNDFKVFYTEMKDQYRIYKFPFDCDEGIRKSALKKYYSNYLSREAMHEMNFPEIEKPSYDTEYNSNFSVNDCRYQKLPENNEMAKKMNEIMTYYTYNKNYKNKRLLSPFKKYCYFSKPLS